jgi:cyclic-di-AMP phosphodiesterase PgpH
LRFGLITNWKRWGSSVQEAFATLARRFEGRVNQGHLAPSDLLKARRIPLLVFGLIFSIALAWVIVVSGPRGRQLPLVHAGDIAEQTIASPLTADIQPHDVFARNRSEAQKKTPPVFDYDEAITSQWLKKWLTAFENVRALFFPDPKSRKVAPLQISDRVSEVIRKETGQSLITSDLLFLIDKAFSPELQSIFEELGKPLLGRMLSEIDLFPIHYSTGIVVRHVNLGLNETVVNDISRIWSLDHARQLVGQLLANHSKRNDESYQRIARIVQSVVIPNLLPNAALTEKRINAALIRRDAGAVSVRKGQIVLRMGERISEEQEELMESIRELSSPFSVAKKWGVYTAILFLFLNILFYWDLTRRSFLRISLKNALVFAGVTLLTLVCMKLSLPYLLSAMSTFGVRNGAEYLMPVAAGAVLIQLLLGRELSFTFSLLLAISSGLMMERSLFYGIWVFCVCSVAIQSLGACKQRTDLYQCGAWSGLTGALLIAAIDVHQSFGLQYFDFPAFLLHGVGAFVAGMLGSIIASTCIPLLESVLGYTTNLKLLELANFNHPLLHNLMMKAPGTYHHSIMVGSLAEIAADRIKANSLLARVSAYYHDIGKMANPLYFIENQSPQYNPHDHLSPSISARILFSHVKNGTRMGREHQLGDPINDIIQQHHGTTLATYFFNRAQELEQNPEAKVSEEDYRYPGPRPQTREAAIVMIADACEASTRSIADPTPAKIQGMVHNIINRRFLDHQFHDCDLTLKDLKIIEECISGTLLSLYHHRIEYPGQKESLEAKTEEISRKSL